MSETATLKTYNVRLENHPVSYRNGYSSVMKPKLEALEEVQEHAGLAASRGEKHIEPTEKTVYKGTLKPESVRPSKLSDNVIAHYELHKDGYDAPATVNHLTNDELPEEAWFVWHNGGFTIADRFGQIQE